MLTAEWEHRWDFDADLLPLDYANTVEWHASEEPEEKLTSYRDLVGWSWAAGVLEQGVTEILLEQAAKQPEEGERTLARAIEVREAIYEIFSALAAGQDPPEEAIETFNRAFAKAMAHARVEPQGDGYGWGWSGEGQLDQMLWPVLLGAAELLTSGDLDRVGECADDRGCGYLFFDSSRNRSRRWCNMESCGNRAKAQRHYSRKSGQDRRAS